MKELGTIAKTFNLPIQSHLSETVGEIAWVKDLHPSSSSYTHVYDEFGLLTDKTVMGNVNKCKDIPTIKCSALCPFNKR